jgi:NAD+ kinase
MPRLVATSEARVLGHALNDIYLERDSGQTAHLRICVDGSEVVERMVCDGVIVSTALGSTAYALAAGGPAVHFGLHALQLTPIAPHKPRLPTIVLPEGKRIEISVHHPEKRPVRAVADGRDLELVDHVEIALAPERVRLAFFEGHDPTRALIGKLLEG